jgi:hypothetical protein
MPNEETKFIRKGEHTNQAMTIEEHMKTKANLHVLPVDNIINAN